MLGEWPAFQALAKAFAEGEVCLRVAGLTGAARPLVVAELLQNHPRPALVVVASLPDTHQWVQDLKFFGAPVVEFAEREPRLWRGGHHREADAERSVICRRLLAGEPLIVVATPAALEVPLPAPTVFTGATVRLGVGDRLDRELLLEALERAGYERADTVVEVGQWSVRGGIVDVFTPAHASPARLEFFGDDIESIRLFDPTSQRSETPIAELVVLPIETAGPEADAEHTLLDYLPATAVTVIDAPKLLDEPAEDSPGRIPLAERLGSRPRIELELLTGASGPPGFTLDTQSVPRYTGRFSQLAE